MSRPFLYRFYTKFALGYFLHALAITEKICYNKLYLCEKVGIRLEWKENWDKDFEKVTEAVSVYTAEDCRILPFPLYVGKAEWVSVPFAVEGLWTAMAQVDKDGEKSSVLLNQDPFGAFEASQWNVTLPISSPFIFNWGEQLYVGGVKEFNGIIYSWNPGSEPELFASLELERDFAFCPINDNMGLAADTLLNGGLRLRVFDKGAMGSAVKQRNVSGLDRFCRIVHMAPSRDLIRVLGYRAENGLISVFTFFIHPEYLHVTEPEWLGATKENWQICGFTELLGGNIELLLVLSESGKRSRCGVLEV